MVTRKEFLKLSGKVSLGFIGLQLYACSPKSQQALEISNYGPLVKDPNGILDLPKGFTYTIISKMGEPMNDGFIVPGGHDGMAAFPGENGTIVLIRNHENIADSLSRSPFGKMNELYENIDKDLVYDNCDGIRPNLGGTTNIIYNPKTKKVESHFLSLIGTVFNCAGGPTPWNTWLSCEEFEDEADHKLANENAHQKMHGFVFEVKSTATGLEKPVPLKDLGRFQHEAAAVDPKSGVVYLTEDRDDSIFYRFIPNVKGDLNAGGQLQALVIKDKSLQDTRNWGLISSFPKTKMLDVEWIDLDNTHQENNVDDLRLRGAKNGAAIFARSEGISFGTNELYFTATSGGAKHFGQVFRYIPSEYEGTEKETSKPGKIELFIESDNRDVLEACDNIVVTPWGDILLCEDISARSSLVMVNKEGKMIQFANTVKHASEFAGATFSPDGKILFVNLQKPGLTFAIKGPWAKIV